MMFSQRKPNILIIHTDDLGYYDLSLTGSKLYDTPKIDKLAKESVRFSNAYANYPRCTPSRYGMMTATYPVNENKGHLGAIPELKNFIKQFGKAGYNTYYLGKWHLGEGDSSPKGFGYTDSYAAGKAGGLGSRFYPFNKTRKGKPAKYHVPDLEEDGKPGDYASDLMTTAAINFIKNNPKDKPFLTVLAFYSVHTPLEAKKEDIKRNKEQLKHIDFGNTPEYIREGEGRRKMRQDNPVYAGMVENVDENVGRLMKTLEDLGIADNTIVIFSSDHGGLSNRGIGNKRMLATTNLPLRAGKGHMYEGGIKVPLFMGGAISNKSHSCSQVTSNIDLMPTLLDLCGLNKIKNKIDGLSIAKNISNGKTFERTLFWHAPRARKGSTGDIYSTVIRVSDYKLIDFYKDKRVELYNVVKDPYEKTNIASGNEKLVKDLLRQLNGWKKKVNATE